MQQRYAIALTSIPPRFDKLAAVLHSLCEQVPKPECIYLTLPRRYRRFEGCVTSPVLPGKVTLIWEERDVGPALKALPAAQRLAGTGCRLIYCDDDWIYGPHWAAALLTDAPVATTGQAWNIARLKRKGRGNDVAQGFSGVCVDPAWLCGEDTEPPEHAMDADDIWLSALLAHRNVPIKEIQCARNAMSPAFEDAYGLQNSTASGTSRHLSNLAAAAAAHERFGIWPSNASG